MAETEIVPIDRGAEPTETGGPTLEEALRDLSPDLAVEPVEEVAPAPPPEPVEEHHSEAQPRLEDGTFAPPEEVVEEEPTEPVEEVTGEVEPPEGEVEEEVVEEEPSPDALTLHLPTEGDEVLDVEIEADEETRAALTRLQEQADSVVELRAQVTAFEARQTEVQESAEELDAIEHEMRLDPAGFLTERIADDRKVEVALDLLHDDVVFGRVIETLAEWETDPGQRRVEAAERKAARVERKAAVREELRRRRAITSSARDVLSAIGRLVPADMPAKQAALFRADAQRDILTFISDHSIETIDLDKVPKILADRLELYGINGTQKVTRTTATAEVPDTGARLRASRERRIKASVTAPASAGHIPSQARPPKGSTLDDAFKWLDQRTQKGAG
jgi:hypothetical protein